MTQAQTPISIATEAGLLRRPESKTWRRVAKYVAVKSLTLVLSVAVGLYLTILVINLGGAIDESFRAEIAESLGLRIRSGWLHELSEEERARVFAETQYAMEEALGLHEPFLLRSVRWLRRAMVLDLGNTFTSYFLVTGMSGSVESLVLLHLPPTLAVFGTANLLLFLFSVFFALRLSRRAGGLLDRLVILLSPLTSAPSWIYGIILVMIFSGQLMLLPYPRSVDIRNVRLTWPHVTMLAHQAILPILSVFVSAFLQGIYAWRTFFLISSEEDYVDLARAKGLSPRVVERRYILRPALPYVITNFALLMIGLWQNSLALEWFFRWPGIGTLFLSAIGRFNTPLALGIVTTFAYMLAVTALVLDVIYVLLDPRVHIDVGSASVRLLVRKERRKPRGKETWPERNASRSRTVPPIQKATGSSPRPTIGYGLCWVLRDLVRHPMGVVGLFIVLAMIGVSLHTVIAIPADQAISLWLSQGSDGSHTSWYANPVNAMPEWTNLFRREKLPSTLILNNRDGTASKETVALSPEMSQIDFWFTFEYPYRTLPQDVVLSMESMYTRKAPLISLTWYTPDGRELQLGRLSLSANPTAHYISRDERLRRRLGTGNVMEGLFASPSSSSLSVLSGTYRLHVTGFVFEPGGELNAELVVYGQVAGLAGTDSMRRDLTLPLRWGMPVALVFGLLGAIATNLVAMILAATGAWFGGWIDHLIQRFCEVNIILPTLPIAILVFIMYSKSIWAILGVIVLLNIFGNSLKNYRAAFLQIKEMPYIEAARAYGAGHWRIIWHYLVPRILPLLIPQLVTMVPGYVFYEATLAYLGVSDPRLPTWGKIINEALTNHALQYHPMWLIEPLLLLLVMAWGFALLGMSLDRVLNPRLREE